MRLLFLTLIMIATACAHSHDPDRDDKAILDLRGADTETLERQKIPETKQAAQLNAKVPQQLLDKAQADLAARINSDAIQVHSAQYVTWPDGAMGCPKPGMMYTQALVSGYHIIFKADDKVWDYRVSEKGMLVLCEQPIRNIEQKNPAS